MRDYNALNRAVKLASDYFEAIGVSITNECLMEQAEDWYDGIETDSTADGDEVIAACIIAYGNYKPIYTYKDIRAAHDEYFPEDPQYQMHGCGGYDDIAIWDIEAAMHDMDSLNGVCEVY